ncbi:MAG: VPLPA-CTERM sorting domain-containing protein [Methylomicrobium sp.]|nr:VPLPA-CTERM sorting domain-containing protein [Methylomicrobium sp.]
MKKNYSYATLLTGVLMVASGTANAASVLFTSFDHYGSDPVDYVVSIDDLTDGFFNVNVKIAENSSNQGDIRGIAFALNYEITANDISGSDITKIGLNTLNNQGGNNFNGTGSGLFTAENNYYLLSIGSPGSSTGFITSTNFAIASLGNSLEDAFSVFGVRAQSVGPNGSGSSKDISTTVTFDGAPVPVPSAVWFMGSGLIGLIGFSRKGKAPVRA